MSIDAGARDNVDRHERVRRRTRLPRKREITGEPRFTLPDSRLKNVARTHREGGFTMNAPVSSLGGEDPFPFLLFSSRERFFMESYHQLKFKSLISTSSDSNI